MGSHHTEPVFMGASCTIAALLYSASIEVLNVNPRLKKAIILLLYRTDVKVLKDALAHLGPYQTLTSVRYSDPYGENLKFNYY